MPIPAPDGFQIRHRDYGVFQGMALGLRLWYPLSQEPGFGLLRFATACDAYMAMPEICKEHWGQTINPDDLLLEPHDLARSVFLKTRIFPLHTFIDSCAFTTDEGRALADILVPELTAARPVILDFAHMDIIAPAFLESFIRHMFLSTELDPDTLTRLITVAHLSPIGHDSLARIALPLLEKKPAGQTAL
jgi:hypothetical protein